MLKAGNHNFILTLSTGMFCGFFSFYLLNSSLTSHSHYLDSYSLYGHAHSHHDIEDSFGPNSPVKMHSSVEPYHKGDNKEAERLSKTVRILCWIMTSPSNHKKKAAHVKATWAQRCNKFIFVSSKTDSNLGAIDLKVPEGRNHLWEKTKMAFKYIYDNHLDEADWFLKADDDTYVILENLRYILSQYSPNDTVWFGCRFKKYVKEGYMSGGAGYVLSKAATVKFVEEAIANPLKCRTDGGGSEDVEMGKCLENVGVQAIDSRDSLGRGRFFPFVPEHHLNHISSDNWYWDWIYYPSQIGMECCSDTAVSFHYVSPAKMYELEYLLYHLRPFGIHHQTPFPPPLPPDKSGIPTRVLQTYENIEERNLLMKNNSNFGTIQSLRPQPNETSLE